MTFVSTALAMAAVLFGVGAPVSLLVLPRRWRMHWPLMAPGVGSGVIMLVGWFAALAGSQLALGWAWSAVGVSVAATLGVFGRDGLRAVRWIRGGLLRHAAVLVLAILVLIIVAEAPTRAHLGLTTISQGSCDAADYAAGAALLRDIRPGDLSGFNGQVETVALRSVDTFYGHWLRLNHFGPAALLAWFSRVFDLPLHKLITALAIALHASAVPMVFWIARSGVRVGALGSFVAAASWAFSAPALYGVAQTALGQICTIPAVALLTWIGLRVFAEGAAWRSALRWIPVAVCGFVVVGLAYTFSLIFILGPLAGSLVWLAWLRRGGWARLARAAMVGGIALGFCTLLLAQRFLGLADRFALFADLDFGWSIPVLTPGRWLGWFGDADLGARRGFGGWLLVSIVLVSLGGYAFVRWRRDRAVIGVAVLWLGATVAGYAWLALRGTRDQTNELYNAYKMFALLQPLVLAALVIPFRVLRDGGSLMRLGGVVLGLGFVAAHLAGALPVWQSMQRPRLWVDKPLASLTAVADLAEIRSVNMLLEPMWARLWANGMLLGQRQYFRSATYEGRAATPLLGAWDLRDGLLAVDTGDDATVRLPGGYHLVRRESPAALQVDLGSGWYSSEGTSEARWAWSNGAEAEVRFTNPHAWTVRARVRLALQGNGPRTIEVRLGRVAAPLWTGRIGPGIEPISLPEMQIPPGTDLLRIQSLEPAQSPAGDVRLLGFALHNLRASTAVDTP